jgi:hypothetical protein
MEPPRVLSVSQVNAYLACPLKYRFQYVDKIPRPWRVAAMAFGSSVHAAVEWFHRERLAGLIGPVVQGTHHVAVVGVDATQPVGGRVAQPLLGRHAQAAQDVGGHTAIAQC